ncbi:MAG: type II secretion system F family protein [Gaiellaceae bacterium]
MSALLAAACVGLGLVVAFDGLTRPRRPRASRGWGEPVRVASGLLGAAVVYALTGWIVGAAVGAIAGAALPQLVGEHRSLRARIELIDALADAAAGLRDAVRGGLGLSEGLAGLASWGPPSLRAEMAALARDARRAGLASAARRFAERLDDPGADLLAATLAFNARVGGSKVAEVLDAMSEELAAEARTVRELRARQSRQRASALIVALAPVVLLLLLRQVNPGYLAAYDSPGGQTVLAVAACLIATGYAVMLRIARTIEPPRVVVGERE